MERQQKSLQEKLKKKSAELDRAEKRYKTLITVKPAFMEEYERLEQELEGMYQIYVQKYRNTDYLQQELEKYNKIEQEKLDKAQKELKKMREKFKQEEMTNFKHEEELDDGLLQPEEKRGVTRGNSRKDERGGGLRDEQLGERDDEDESQEGDEDSEEEESGEDLEDDDDDDNDSNF